MGSTTILRGFKVSVAILDAFLAANGVDETNGTPPFYEDHPDKDPISILLYTKITMAGGTANKDKFRVMIPSREGHNKSNVAYVTYAWVTVYAHRELRLDNDLPMEIPTGFEELRKEILSFGDGIDDGNKVANEGWMGLFIVYTHDIRGLYIPQEFLEQTKVPQHCDQCDAVFDDPYQAFDKRQQHRIAVHGSIEGRNPLPEA
ncbi:hypothetical protein S7711_10405 [Stachybotrys chartarum IBT 7711]|uniref:C2H2-type domain-containing protein n=1 Tax=Stachybotrys chartarum (strain CBS 109288 / IBT 7711) TaxID=1280523 RepID=A0A084B483_STACB|nr:hypothetical protein S7711_10405 [Stachybotrys chartarum IBT 7711]